MRILIKGDSFDVDPNKVTFGEAKRIESVTGATYSQWTAQLQAGSVTAMQALVWTMLRRSNPDVRFDDIDDLAMSDVALVADDADAVPAAKPNRAARRHADPTKAASKPPAATSS